MKQIYTGHTSFELNSGEKKRHTYNENISREVLEHYIANASEIQ